jgi:methionyl aminopeptidase
MEENAVESYKKAKKISDEVVRYAKSLKFENATALSIAETIENLIFQHKGKPAWPVNVCLNDVAAHFSPLDNTLVLRQGDLVKIDIGVHADGYICDQAFTVCVGEKTHPMITAAEKALDEALKVLKKGVKVCEVSAVIEDTVKSFGFNTIRNLCGHGLDRYVVHAPPTIPNTKNEIQDEIAAQAIAIEVFATDGVGWVKESEPVTIYQFRQDKPIRMWEARKILEKAKVQFEGLPFSPRWTPDIPKLKFDMAIKQLVETDSLIQYPVLREESGRPVAVAEATALLFD